MHSSISIGHQHYPKKNNNPDGQRARQGTSSPLAENKISKLADFHWKNNGDPYLIKTKTVGILN